MDIRAVDFVSYQVSDLDRAIGFYRDTLGVPLDYVFENFWAELSAGQVTIALTTPQQGQQVQPGGAAVALAVEDVAAAVAELRDEGVPILLEPQETPVCHFAMISDPDGNPLWLHRRKDGTAG